MSLIISNLHSGYGKKEVLHGISLTINEKEIVVMIGHNGAGKTTLLKSIFGLVKINSGDLNYNQNKIRGFSPDRIMQAGIVYVPQERNVFPSLTVLENLQVSDAIFNHKDSFEKRLDQINELFPIIRERSAQRAGTLSGGEQKMLALSMALIIQPKLILLDEPSLGLSPINVKRFMDTLQHLNKEMDFTIFLIEQNVKQSLRIANRVYVMKGGLISNEYLGEELMNREDLWKLM